LITTSSGLTAPERAEIAPHSTIGDDRRVTRPGTLVLAILTAVTLVTGRVGPAEAQHGRGRAAPRPSQLAPGEYSLDFERILEVVNRGEARQALAYYERVAAQAEQQGDRRRAGQADMAIALVTFRLGLYQQTIQSGSRAIELLRAAAPVSNETLDWVATVYSNVGPAYRLVGDLAQARKVLEEGLAYVETQRGQPAAPFAAGYLGRWLSYVDYDQGDYKTALAHASSGFEFFKDGAARLRAGAPDRQRWIWHRQAALSGTAVGRAQRALGHPDEADAAFDLALQYARVVGLRELEVDILMNQGDLALSRQDWSKAVARYQRGLPLAHQIGSVPYLAGLNAGLARAWGGLGRTDDALAAAREAVRDVEEQRGELGAAGLRSGFLEGRQGIYQQAVQLALQAQRPDEAFAFAERSRARAFLDLLGSQTTLSKGKTRGLVDEEVRLRARLAEAQALAQGAGDSEDPAAARAPLEAAERDYRAFLERVRKESLEQVSLMSVEPVTLSEIQGLLPEGTTLIEYLVGTDHTIVWVVDRQSAKVVRIPGDSQTLVAQVRQFRAAVSQPAPLADVQAQARALYDRLFEPARGEIRSDQLLIVPHGVLHYMPFAALRSAAGRWLAEDFGLSTLPSASVLRYLGDKGVGVSDRALIVGNPDVGAGLALRWAEREARVVGQGAPGATVLVRADATEAQVKKLLESAGIIHFATHGELSESDPLSSALLLVPGEGEDGRLEVRELLGLDLHARLVVLSACETGLGKLSRGDELVGLQRAFLYAGTPTVVTTFWKVDDRASYELVRSFYEHLKKTGAADALRQAQLETMRTFPHPFAWAAFGLTGVPR
jgi:CHAT domain-containing protein